MTQPHYQASIDRLEVLAGSQTLPEQHHIEGLYAIALGDSTFAPDIERQLHRFGSDSVVARAWLALLTASTVPLPASVYQQCPARTKALLAWREVGLLYDAGQLANADARWRELGSPNLEATAITGRTERSPMVIAAARTAISLSADLGLWSQHAEFVRFVSREFALDTVARATVELSIAQAACNHSRYKKGLGIVKRWGPRTWTAGWYDVALAFAALELEILANTGVELPISELGDQREQRRLAARDAWQRVIVAGGRLRATPTAEGATPLLRQETIDGWVQSANSAAVRLGIGHSPEEPNLGINALLLREHEWRTNRPLDPRVGAEIEAALTNMLGKQTTLAPRERLLVRLARNRMRVDLYGSLGARERRRLMREGTTAEQLERVDAQVTLELERRLEDLEGCVLVAEHGGLRELEMLATDHRAYVLDRLGRIDEAEQCAQRAGERAIELLYQNATDGTGDVKVERGLLERLWPAFDRSIELQVQRAWQRRNHESWDSVGRELYARVEQLAALSLQEVRRVHAGEGEETVPHRFAWTAEDGDSSALACLQVVIPPHEAILQYFVSTNFVLVFAIGRTWLAWEPLAPVHEGEDISDPSWSSRDLRAAIEDLTGGRWDGAKLQPLPSSIVDRLNANRIKHLLLIPHGPLWDVPFTSMPIAKDHLGGRFALSFHACGRAALEALLLRQRCADQRDRGPSNFVVGPGLENPQRFADLGRMLGWRGAEPQAEAPLPTGPQTVEVMCHGTPARSSKDSGDLELGEDRLRVTDVHALSMQEVPLLALYACWAGRPATTSREDPVLGFPQAFLDAGVASVIAARFPVPEAMIPYVADLLHVSRQFLPIEVALSRTFAFLDKQWQALLATDRRLMETAPELIQVSPREVEFRLFGAPGYHANAPFPKRAGYRILWYAWRICPGLWRRRHRRPTTDSSGDPRDAENVRPAGA